MPGGSPTVRRRRLAHELRRLRDEARLTIEEVASALECSDSKISRIETARVGATPRDVRDMLSLYGVGPDERESLIQLARQARQKGWWHPYSDLQIVTLVGLEAAASSMRVFGALLIPGLLQTERYARAVLGAVLPKLHSDEIERRVQLRLRRQTRLKQEDAPELWVVLDEAALRRPVGGREVMREQLELLVEVADLPKTTLQVLPLAHGAHGGMDGDFTIIDFPERADPEVVYIESKVRDVYVEDPDDVKQYTMLFNHLRADAISRAESKALVSSVVKEIT
jgi:transcriptional regulator with XRE-family HTH domain